MILSLKPHQEVIAGQLTDCYKVVAGDYIVGTVSVYNYEKFRRLIELRNQVMERQILTMIKKAGASC